jgi:hypothetical protein
MVRQLPRNAWFVLFVGAVIGVSYLGRNPRGSFPVSFAIVSDSGRPLPSLFAGMDRHPLFEAGGLNELRPSDNQCSAGGSIRRLLSRLDVQKVYAVTCTPSSCGGHYIAWNTHECGACDFGATYDTHFTNSSLALYEDGWYYTGAEVCNGCFCEELDCSNP